MSTEPGRGKDWLAGSVPFFRLFAHPGRFIGYEDIGGVAAKEDGDGDHCNKDRCGFLHLVYLQAFLLGHKMPIGLTQDSVALCGYAQRQALAAWRVNRSRVAQRHAGESKPP